MLESFTSDVGIFYTYVASPSGTATSSISRRSSFAGVFPTHDGQACVWLCRPAVAARDDQHGRIRTAATRSSPSSTGSRPALGDRARDGHVTAPVRGIAGSAQLRAPGLRPGWALVGDAGYHRDPITGHGITDAFRDAELLRGGIDRHLATAPTSRRADGYEQARDAALREMFDLTCALTAFPRRTASSRCRFGSATHSNARRDCSASLSGTPRYSTAATAA